MTNETQPEGGTAGSREYRSSAGLCGLPLVHVARGRKPGGGAAVANGWIAVGDVAYGVLFACGGVAVGGVAVGGTTVGVLSVGGCSLGVVSLAGVALGLLAIGGAAIGVWAYGGLALGVFSIGGAAIAWKAASGGLAVAHDFAVGGGAFAAHANDALAQRFVEDHAFFRAARAATPYTRFLGWLWLLALIPLWMTWRRSAAARRGSGEEREPSNAERSAKAESEASDVE